MHGIVEYFNGKSDRLSILTATLSALLAGTLLLSQGTQTEQPLLMRGVVISLLLLVLATTVYSVVTRRKFLRGMFSIVKPSKGIPSAGIVNVTDAFIKGVDWSGLISQTGSLDIMFAYGKTWRETCHDNLSALARKKGSKIRMILPDYCDEHTIKELADRFDYLPENLVYLIQEAENHFMKLKRENGADIEIHLISRPPLFTFYRFDDILIVALYSHSRNYSDVPAFISKKGGVLYSYIQNEISEIMKCSDFSRKTGGR